MSVAKSGLMKKPKNETNEEEIEKMSVGFGVLEKWSNGLLIESLATSFNSIHELIITH